MSVLPELLLFSWVICFNSALILPAAVFQIKDHLYIFIICCNCRASFIPVHIRAMVYIEVILIFILVSMHKCYFTTLLFLIVKVYLKKGRFGQVSEVQPAIRLMQCFLNWSPGPACFSDIPSLSCADNLNQVCSEAG